MKTAIITGCNRGIGFTLMRRFAESGYNIVAHTRKYKEEWDAQCRSVENVYNIKVHNVYFDLAKQEEVIRGLSSIAELDIPIDVLVNNAGVLLTRPLMYVSYEDMMNTFMVNYFSLAMITKEIGSVMMHHEGGCIINISSCMGGGHQPGGACYDASKAAVNQFTRSIAQEFAPFNIRVNAVAGGVINTEMVVSLQEKARKKMIKATALKRLAEPDEIADVVLFLASEKASYITGTILPVDGGQLFDKRIKLNSIFKQHNYGKKRNLRQVERDFQRRS